MSLDRLTVYHLQTPLARPYQLSFGAVHQFDSFVAVARFGDGSLRVGESTPLPGYSHETPDLLMQEYRLLSQHGRLKLFLDSNQKNPFVTTPILTCLDPTLAQPVGGEVALCPILQWNDPCEIADRVAELAQRENKVLKVKISADLDETRRVVGETTKAAARCGVRLRYDANQALDPKGAASVVRWLEHPTTELLEQPFPVEAWKAMADLYEWCPIPLMLDESILDAADVFKAADCADFIKLKLAKNGSPSRLLELIRQAREIGLKVILGNGVQGAVGCWLEGQVQVLAGLEHPGEMNGYRKLRANVLGPLCEETITGFRFDSRVDLTTLACLLKKQSLHEYVIPVATPLAA